MDKIMDKIKKLLCVNIMRLISLAIAAYFFYAFHSIVGFPPKQELNASSTTYLIISIFFFLLPLAKKLKIGKLLEYEAKVNEIKQEVKEFKDDTRQILSMQNTLINTVSNTISQSINITLPGQGEIQEAREDLDDTIKDPIPQDKLEDEIDDFLALEGSDINFALAKLRIDIEKELRRILIKRLDTDDPTKMTGRFLSARSLFREFIKLFPKYSGMHGSFDYILKICNAAIHGQNISSSHAQEALQMGFKMLDELKKVDGWL
jgi:flagellar basal body-associated protein FliL